MLNPKTGRIIQVGGRTWQKLQKAGAGKHNHGKVPKIDVLPRDEAFLNWYPENILSLGGPNGSSVRDMFRSSLLHIESNTHSNTLTDTYNHAVNELFTQVKARDMPISLSNTTPGYFVIDGNINCTFIQVDGKLYLVEDPHAMVDSVIEDMPVISAEGSDTLQLLSVPFLQERIIDLSILDYIEFTAGPLVDLLDAQDIKYDEEEPQRKLAEAEHRRRLQETERLHAKKSKAVEDFRRKVETTIDQLVDVIAEYQSQTGQVSTPQFVSLKATKEEQSKYDVPYIRASGSYNTPPAGQKQLAVWREVITKIHEFKDLAIRNADRSP